MECAKLRAKIEKLGNIIVKNIPFDNVEPIFMETDFKNRTTFDIIAYYNIYPFVIKRKLS